MGIALHILHIATDLNFTTLPELPDPLGVNIQHPAAVCSSQLTALFLWSLPNKSKQTSFKQMEGQLPRYSSQELADQNVVLLFFLNIQCKYYMNMSFF